MDIVCYRCIYCFDIWLKKTNSVTKETTEKKDIILNNKDFIKS